MSNPTYAPLHEKLGEGPISFTVGTTLKADLQTVWDHICKAELVTKYFPTAAVGDLDNGGRSIMVMG